MTSVAFHIDQLMYRVPGGTGTYIRELVPALAGADPALELTLFHARFERPTPPELPGFPRTELSQGIRSLYPRWNITGRPTLPASISALDILHAPSPAAIPPPGAKQRLVVTVHDLAFRVLPQTLPPAWRAMFRTGLRRAARHADALIAVSRNTATDLVRAARVDAERVHVVHLAPSLPSADPGLPLGVAGEMKVPRPYVLFVGTLEPRKNLVRLVRAYRRAVGKGLPHALVLAGPLGWRAQRLHRELAVHGPGRVVLTGPVSTGQLDALYREADAFVYPSLYEGFGLPVLDAMARGVPTIVSSASSLPEVAGDAAIQVHPRSVRNLAEAIERVLTDEAEAKRLSAAALNRAALFSWEQTARMTLKVYESIL